MNSRNVYIFIGIVVLVCLAIVGIIYIELASAKHPEFLKDIAKSFLQLGTLGTLGALVKYAIDQISVAGERRLAVREFKKGLLSQLRETHQTIRAVPYLIEQEKTISAYKVYMLQLLEARTILTDIGNDIKTSEIDDLSKSGVYAPLGKMTEYLSELLRESVELEPQSWQEIENLLHYSSYREATLQFSGSNTKSTSHGQNYDIHYEDAKEKLREMLVDIQ